MAGHSKWSNIKHKKGVNDAKKSKIFTKLAKEITVAARSAGGEPEFNPRLRLAVQNAKGANMPKEAILRAISKASGHDVAAYHEVTYEGCGPHGVAIMVVCMTDKIVRTVANVRAIFTKYGGSLEKSGAIAFLFDYKGVFTIPAADIKGQDDFTLGLIDAGAEALENDVAYAHVICGVEDFGKVQKHLETLAIAPTSAGLKYIPRTLVQVSDAAFLKLIKLIDALKDDDDIQKVYHNINIQPEQETLWE
ncbi:YebC/PmpR family DNA-binding transcriptional regulator [Cardinium endosymbiont of Oedothorax gibbosus]|uniref:YebC/PmpR family DNA-binding transcriptional regulator n=1 Tax=Cardinium endosymbiont of Oedothorax gibbosus TaxID=931101 RepID=UPI0020241D08|nr:YebC/PmpR family DNA-binding transcriptional regulator [Cardinium endosymbiont of Oedothorax gibbosus]CAH2559997.1 Transcriptional regulator TACO1-like family protein [Cardinium endosymbiont of Oedothorax gibbosus]